MSDLTLCVTTGTEKDRNSLWLKRFNREQNLEVNFLIRKQPNKHREERKLNMKKKKIYLRRKMTQNKM